MSRNRYILEINPDIAKSIVVFSMVGERGITAAFKIDDLEVLNSDYINEHYGELQDEAYQRGLENAWDVARKLAVGTDDGGVSISDLYKIFGTESMCTIMKNNTVYDAIDKLKAYEDKQKADDEINVGDEVRSKRGWTAVVVKIDDGGLMLMDSSGAVGSYSDISKFSKTGRHFDIQSILEAMRK
jgi:hypothetical protein